MVRTTDDYTMNFGALAGIVSVADTPPANVFDRLFVVGTSGADVLVVTPTFVTRNATETVNYSGVEALTVDAGDGNDNITVDGTSVPTKVLGGSGDDSSYLKLLPLLHFTYSAINPVGRRAGPALQV